MRVGVLIIQEIVIFEHFFSIIAISITVMI